MHFSHLMVSRVTLSDGYLERYWIFDIEPPTRIRREQSEENIAAASDSELLSVILLRGNIAQEL